MLFDKLLSVFLTIFNSIMGVFPAMEQTKINELNGAFTNIQTQFNLVNSLLPIDQFLIIMGIVVSVEITILTIKITSAGLHIISLGHLHIRL